ncbi:MAG: cadmium-translocating P-type ATPase [Chthonomonadaceae bacterium]|nr:cadmium-translocating P-type ATPase [Chthonomonadaceae bacterium]
MVAIAEIPASKKTVAPEQWQGRIALLALCGIAFYLVLRFGLHLTGTLGGVAIQEIPLLIVLAIGGAPLLFVLIVKVFHREFGADLLAGISILTSVALHEYLAGALVVLMLSGGQTIENYALRNASSALAALAKRMPTRAQRREGDQLVEVALSEVKIGDILEVFPHELCPVDGTVIEGHGSMDESYLTGEPYNVSKAPGTGVLSGAINGDSMLAIRCDKPANDSRYSKIMQVMRDSEQQRPLLRRLGDRLGAWYTPLAVLIALIAWAMTADPLRFLAVLVVATPCPLLIAIPVAIIGSISVAAARGIIIKDPSVLENISTCRVALFDKTGTLTYGKPKLTEILFAKEFTEKEILTLVASLERYSKHPLSGAITEAADQADITLQDAAEVRELPGDGLHATIQGHRVHVTGRGQIAKIYPQLVASLPAAASGMECIVLVDDHYAATFQFRDEPRPEGARFIRHLAPKHGIRRVMLVSGDREGEVAYLAKRVGITEVFSSQSPEQKLALVRAETLKAPTLFLGDGINDAPALTAATVGIAFGNNSEITGEAADAVILDSSLEKVDVLLHISYRMRLIALQSAIGGMILSVVGMGLAATGHLTPVAGAMSQEIIDVLAVLNALRAAFPPKVLSDY